MPLKTLKPRLAVFDTRRLKPPAKVRDDFYHSPEWRALMREIFRERGRRCQDPQCATPHGPWGQLYGDHVREIRDGGARLDKANVLIRCSPCHGRKTTAERARRAAERYG
jgi:5-methylcytosine-specific restriction enzyme A